MYFRHIHFKIMSKKWNAFLNRKKNICILDIYFFTMSQKEPFLDFHPPPVVKYKLINLPYWTGLHTRFQILETCGAQCMFESDRTTCNFPWPIYKNNRMPGFMTSPNFWDRLRWSADFALFGDTRSNSVLAIILWKIDKFPIQFAMIFGKWFRLEPRLKVEISIAANYCRLHQKRQLLLSPLCYPLST